MSLFKRIALKLAWRRMVKLMPWLNRWAPVIGGGILVAATLLRLFGQGEAAGALEGIGAALGLTGQSPVPAAEIAVALTQLAVALTQLLAAGTLAYGIGRKLWAAVRVRKS